MHFTALQDVEKVPHLESPGKRSIMQKLLHLVAALGNIMLLSEWKSFPLPPGILQKLLGQEGLGFSHSGAISHGWSRHADVGNAAVVQHQPPQAALPCFAEFPTLGSHFPGPRNRVTTNPIHQSKHMNSCESQTKVLLALPKDQPLLIKNRSISSELETWLHRLATYSSLLMPLHPHL